MNFSISYGNMIFQGLFNNRYTCNNNTVVRFELNKDSAKKNMFKATHPT